MLDMQFLEQEKDVDLEGDIKQSADKATHVLTLEQTVARTQVMQYRYWWLSTFHRRAGEAVSRMWQLYPFGALILDDNWGWWSLSRVIAEGQELAAEAGHPKGLAIASAMDGIAVLDWSDGLGDPGCIHLVSYRALKAGASSSGEGWAALSPERFLRAKGFDRPEALVACAYCEHQPRGRRDNTFVPAAVATGQLQAAPVAKDPASYQSRRGGIVASAMAPRAHAAQPSLTHV